MMRLPRFYAVAVLSAFASLSLPPLAEASDVTSPAAVSSPDSTYRPSSATDEGGLWMLSDKMERDVQRSPLLVRDEALNAYISGLVCRLAGPDCPSIRVYILDIPYFNANMSPNGAMQVWTGLLLRVRNEAQLSFILAHEIAHFKNRDSINRYQSVRDTASAVTFISLATGGIGGIVAGLAAAGSLSAYSRDQERAADAHGFDTLKGHNYDPGEGAVIWQQIIEEEKANPNHEEGGVFFASHPASAERLETLAQMAASVSKTGVSKGEAAYLAATAHHRASWLEGELNRGKYGQSRLLIGRLLQDEPASAELHFYLAEAYRRENANADALTNYSKAVKLQNVPVGAWRGLGLVALKQKDNEAARNAFNQYLALAPDADDRAMIEFYLSGL